MFYQLRIFFILFLFTIISCSKRPDNPQKMAESLYRCLQKNNFRKFNRLFAKQSDYQNWYKSHDLNPDEVENFDYQIDLLNKNGFFSEDTISKVFGQLINYPLLKEVDFWKHSKIKEFEGTDPELNTRGIEQADVYLTITGKGLSLTLKTGEMYRPGQKWIITNFPKWVN